MICATQFRTARRCAAIGAAVVIGAAGVGCGSSDTSVSAEQVRQAEEEMLAQLNPRPIERGPVFEPERVYRWGIESATDGSTAELVVEIGEPVAARDATSELPDVFQEYAQACGVDEQRDVLLPLRLRLINTTSGFSIQPTVQFVVSSMARVGYEVRQVVSAGTTYNGSPDCNNGESVLMSVTFAETEAERTSEHSWTLAIHGFYSPTSPEGDVEAFGDLDAGLMVVGGDGLSWRPTCVTGPENMMWTGTWRPSFRALFPLLDVAPRYGGSAPERLAKC